MRFYLSASLVLLLRSHHAMCQFFTKELYGECKLGLLAAVHVINNLVSDYTFMLMATLADSSQWLMLQAVGVEFNQWQKRHLLKELLRLLSGVLKRAVAQFQVPPLPTLIRAAESDLVDDDSYQDAVDVLEDNCDCCNGLSGSRLARWLTSDAVVRRQRGRVLKKALKHWKGAIHQTERLHSGNKRRCRARHGAPRRLRRQAAQHLCASVKAVHVSRGGNTMALNRGGIKFDELKKLCAKRSKRIGVGSNVARTYCNQKREEMQGQGYPLAWFRSKASEWKKEASSQKKKDWQSDKDN